MTILVVKKSDTVPQGYTPVYIGRGSAFGNPFVMQDPSDNERDRVCEAFRSHLRQAWQAARQGHESAMVTGIIKLAQRVNRGEKLALQCFCAPKRCHGHTIKTAIEWQATQQCQGKSL